MTTRSHLLIAAALTVAELILGIGLAGGAALVIAIVLFVSSVRTNNGRLVSLRAASLYLFVFITTIGWLSFNWRTAQQQARPIITSVGQYRENTGVYPASLDQLVPTYLPSIPKARYTLVGNRFGYSGTNHVLFFPATFHGTVSYLFDERRWVAND